MSPFEPAGERARWRMLYDLLLAKDLDDTLTYEEMAQATDLEYPGDKTKIQLAFRRAAKEFETENNHAAESIPNVGYRIVLPSEHLRLARTHERKSGRSLMRGQSKVVHVDLNGMEPEIKRAFEITARAFAVLIDYSRRLDSRQSRVEQALDSMAVRQDRSDDEVAELRLRLARLEGNPATSTKEQ